MRDNNVRDTSYNQLYPSFQYYGPKDNSIAIFSIWLTQVTNTKSKISIEPKEKMKKDVDGYS